MPTLLFKENQKFTQWWLWILLIGVACIPLYASYRQLILEIPFGSNPMSDLGLILFSIFMLAFLGFFFSLRLQTHIDDREIYIRYFPFLRKRILWSEIKSAEVVNYGFVGYGVRYGSKYGIVYNTNGNKGLAIEMKNGKKLCIGTQKPEALEKIILQHSLNQRDL